MNSATPQEEPTPTGPDAEGQQPPSPRGQQDSALRRGWKKIRALAYSQQQKPRMLIPGAQPKMRFRPPTLATTVSEEKPDADQGQQPAAPVERSQKFERPEITVAKPIFVGFMVSIGVGIALLCLWVLTNIGALSGWIVGALFVALGLDPAVQKLEKLGLPRIAGVFTVVIAFALSLLGLLSWVIPKVANQTVQLINGFPDTFEQFLNSSFFTGIDEKFKIRNWVDNEVNESFAAITSDTNVVSGFLNSLATAGSTVANIITGTIIVLFLSLYFLASLPMMKAWLVRLTPASRRQRVGLLTEKITGSVGNYVMGQAIVALLNGSYPLIIMLITQVPYPQLLTLFVVILAFIPLIGGVSAGVLVSLLSLMSSWHTALIFAICYFIYLQVEAYFISPRIMSKAVAVPGGVAVIAVAAGGALWGVLGALIAIPVAASLLILVQEVLIPRQDQH